PPPRTASGQPALRPGLPPLRARLDHHHLKPRLRAVGRDPRRRDGRRRPHRPARPPPHPDHAPGQELPPARTRPRPPAPRSRSAAPRLRLNGGKATTNHLPRLLARRQNGSHRLDPDAVGRKPADRGRWRTFRLRVTEPEVVHFSAPETGALFGAP